MSIISTSPVLPGKSGYEPLILDRIVTAYGGQRAEFVPCDWDPEVGDVNILDSGGVPVNSFPFAPAALVVDGDPVEPPSPAEPQEAA